MPNRLRNGLKNTVAVAPKLKLRLRLITITSLSLAVIVALRVFSSLNFGAVATVNAAKNNHIQPKTIKIAPSDNLVVKDSLKELKKGLRYNK